MTIPCFEGYGWQADVGLSVGGVVG